MSETTGTPNRRRTRDDVESTVIGAETGGTRKRRAFLKTMGQQLREFGIDGTSTQSNTRTTFGTSHTSTLNEHTPESDAAPGEDDQLPAGAAKNASHWIWRLDEVLPPSSAEHVPSVLEFEDLLDWSQSYFDHWHPAFPLLHAPSFIDFLRRFAQASPQLLPLSPSEKLWHIILRSVMSISVADRRQMDTPYKLLPSTLVFHSFNDALNSIQLVLTEESSIASLQALVSVQLFLITMHRYNAASRLEGIAVRLAFQLGLHRCPHRSTSMSGKEVELRKRLFWSIYCIDRYVCIRLGTPLGIRSDEMDVCFPHNECHVVRGEDAERDDRLNLLEFLARHASIRGAIMENRNKSDLRNNNDKDENILEVEAEHNRWWNTVDEYLSDDEGTQSIVKAHQVTLLVLRFESVLALHRSVLATSKKDSAYNAALQRCISASRSIINTLHKAIKGVGAFDGSPGERGYESTPLVWPSYTWAVWMSVFIIIFAASEGQFARKTALRLADRSIQILQHLALRGTNWPEACIIAVQNLTARLREGSTRSSTVAPESLSAPSHPSTTSFKASRGVMMPPGLSRNTLNQPSFTSQNLANNNAAYNSSSSFGTSNDTDISNPASAYLSGAGLFLGIAQQTSDNPISHEEIMHLFNADDMGFWSGDNLGYGGNFSI